MKKEIPMEWKIQYEQLKKEWIDHGCPKTFYLWLLDRVEGK